MPDRTDNSVVGNSVTAADDGSSLAGLVELFFSTRRPRKDSLHMTAAYRRDFSAITQHVAAVPGTTPVALRVGDLSVSAVRDEFGWFADSHAKTSIARAWSTWNQFFNFLVAEGVREGHPVAAIPKPRLPRRSPKPLSGEDTPEILLQTALTPVKGARRQWPERDVAILATLLFTGRRSAELLDLRIDSMSGRPGERRIQIIGKGGKTALGVCGGAVGVSDSR
ncbi:MAG: hypothetical protein ABI382_11795 [Nakamurella sp.]